MPENDILYTVRLTDGRTDRLTQQQYDAIKNKLFTDDAGAEVIRTSVYDRANNDALDTDTFRIQLPDGRSDNLTKAQLDEVYEPIMRDNPGTKVYQVSDMSDRYWRPKLEEAQSALQKFNGEHGSFIGQYELYQDVIENRSPKQETFLLENMGNYRDLIRQRDALREAVVSNPIVKRGRLQAEEQAIAARQNYLDLASQAETGAERRDYKRAAKLQGDAAELFGAPGQYDKTDKNGFAQYMSDYGKGALNTFSDRDFWTRGLTQIARDIDLHGIRKKVEEAEKAKGAPLEEGDFDRIISPSEKAQLFSFYNLARAQAERANDLSSAYKAGTSAAESVGYMAEFLLSTGLGNVAGKALSASSNGFARWMGQALMSEKALGRAIDKGVTAPMQMSRLGKIGTEIARPMVQGLWHTPTQLSTYSNMARMMNETNDEGELNSFMQGVWLGFADSLVENWSESFGNTIDIGMDALGKGLGWAGNKALGKTTFGQMARYALHSPFAQTLKEAGFNGFFGEMMEEWAGNAVRLATGLMDKDEFKQFASIQQQLEMAASFAPMSLFGLAGNVVSTAKYKKEYDKLSPKVKDILLKNNPDAGAQAAINELFERKWATSEDIAAGLAPYAQQVLNSGSSTAQSDYETILKFAGMAGANAFNEAVTDYQNEQNRSAMRETLTAQIGREFWQNYDSPQARDADGNPVQIQQVRVVDFADGSRRYIIGGMSTSTDGQSMNREYLTIDENGRTNYITDEQIQQGMEDGTITADREMMLDDYLQERVDASQKDEESKRMQRELQTKLAAVKARIAQQPSFDMGTPEAPRMATVTEVFPEGVNVTYNMDGTQVTSSLSWKEVGDYIGMPISAQTDAQIAEEAAYAQQQAEQRKTKYNQINPGTPITVTMPGAEGDEQVQYHFAKAIYDENEGFVRIYVADENGNVMTDQKGNEVWFPEDMVQGLDALAEQSQQPAVAPEPVEPETPETPAEAPVAPVSRYTNEAGKVNQTAFMKNEPEEWAKWNDSRRQDGGANSKERLAAAIGELDKEIADLNKKKAATANPDDADAIEERVNGLVERHSRLKAIYDGYIAAENAIREAENAARRAEFERQAAAKKEQEAKKQADLQQNISDDAQFQQIQQDFAAAKKVQGDEDTLIFGGQEFTGHYYIVEAEAPTASHKATEGWVPTPGFPKDETGRSLNTRDYEHEPESQQHVMQTASEYDSRAMQHMIVVTSDGIVISGNERTMASQIAAQQNTDGKYIDYLKKHPNKYGFTAEQVEGFQHPRVIFVPDAPVPYTAKLFDLFNKSEEKRQNTVATAAKVAKITDDALVMRIADLFYDVDDINAVYRNPQMVNTLLGILESAGVMSREDRPMYVDQEGKLTGAGEDFIESVLFGSIFSSSDQAVRDAMRDKSIRQAVAFAFPTLVRIRNLSGEYSIIREMTDAVSLLSRAKSANKGKAEGAIADYMNQFSLFSEGLPVERATVQLLAEVLNDRKYSTLRSVLNQYIGRAEAADSGQMDMFTGEVEAKEQILRDILATNNINIETYDNTQSGVPENAQVPDAAPEQGSSGSSAQSAGEGGAAAEQGEGTSVNLLDIAKEQAKKNRKLQKILKRVDKWKKFLGNAFEVATGIEDIEKIEDAATRQQILDQINAGQVVEGWFANGKAVIYLPNIPDERTLDRKVMHEVISHKGIKGLFEAKGKGEFDKFCQWVWDNLMNDAARGHFINYPGVNGSQKAAADEFLAHCAENETAVIAQLDENFWTRLAEALKNFVNDAMGEDVFNTEDGWFAQLLKDATASIQQGAAAEQEDAGALFSIANAFSKSREEFDAMQKLAEQKRGIVATGLYDVAFPIQGVPRHGFAGSGKQAIEKARKWAEDNLVGGHKYHEGQPDEFSYEITGGKNGSIGEMLSKISTTHSDNLGVHLAVLRELPAVIDASYDVEIHADYTKENGHRTADNKVNPSTLIHRLYGAVNIEGQIYRVKTTIEEHRDKKNDAYTYQVTKVELLISGSAASDALSNSTISAAKLLKEVEKSYDSGKKLLDAEYLDAVDAGNMAKAQELVNKAAAAAMPNTQIANRAGTPVVVYHGTSLRLYDRDYIETVNEKPFTVFSVDRQMGAHFGNRKQAENRASAKAEADGGYIAEEYIYPVFLNITNPAFTEDVHVFDFQHLVPALVEDNVITTDEARYISSDRNLKELLESKGYDGLVYTNRYEGTGDSFVAFHPEQIKSAEPVTRDDNGNVIPLSERFNPEKSDIRFSVAEPNTVTDLDNDEQEGTVLFSVKGGKGEKTLVGIHNISARKLAAAVKTGGLANPSMAVIDLSFQKHEDFGEISLIAPSSLIDSETGRNAGTYTGDAWTPTYPGVSKQMSDKGWDKFWDDVRDLPYPFDTNTRNDWREYLEDDRMGRSLRWWFLQDTGRNPEIIHHSVNLSDADRELFKSLEGKERHSDVLLDEELWPKVVDLYKRLGDPAEVERAQQKVPVKEGRGRFTEYLEARNREVDDWGIWTSPVFDLVESLQRELRMEGAVAETATYQAAEKFIEDNNLQDAFDQWLQNKEKEYGVKSVLFAGWTRDGDKKYVPNTVENASRLMNKEPEQNSYGNGGVNATRSLLLDRMKSLSEIRKNRGLLGTFEGDASETDEYKEATDNWFNVIDALAQKQKVDDNQFINIDIAESRLQEAIQQRDPIAYLNREYRYHLDKDGEFAEDLKASLKEIKALPAKYFETKFNRPVYLNEFAAAVVPSDTRADVRKELEKAGLPIYEYDSKLEGSRKETVLKASEADGIRFSVRNGYEDERSAYQGNGTWAAPGAPFDKEQFRNLDAMREAVEEGWDVNLWAIAQGVTPQPDDYFSANGPRFYSYDDKAGHETQKAISAAMKKIQNGEDAIIKVYRAVPNDIREGSPRNGDWVSPSKTYAENHGLSRFGAGQFRIQEFDAPAQFLWWDGNDAREWGFDDGESYTYKNTPNNRKLTDEVTYDDNGQPIPADRRYDESNPDVRFSVTPAVQREMDSIKAAAQADGTFMKAPNGKATNLSEEQWLLVRTPNFLRYFGDWINDPAGASKILDNNGEPAVVFHGSNWNPLDEQPGEAVFDDSFRGTGSGDNGFFGRGFYFTYQDGTYGTAKQARGEAAFYGRNITEAFLNIRNPFMFNETLNEFNGKYNAGSEKESVTILNMVKNFPELVKDYRVDVVDSEGNVSGEITLAEYAKIFEDTYNNKEFIIKEGRDERDKNIVELCADPVHHEEVINGHKVEWDDYGFRMPMYKPGKNEDAQLAYTHYYLTYLQDMWREDHTGVAYNFPSRMFSDLFESEEFTQALKDKGYDGVLQSATGDEAVAFQPEQIKSATAGNGEFTDSKDIRFSIEDFNPIRADQTQTKAFKDWFKGSKIVNEDGSPMVVYRGASFDPLSQELGMGVIKPQRFFSPSEDYAKRYGLWTRAYFLNIQNPFDVRNKKDAAVLREFLPKGYQFHVGPTGALDWAELSAFDLDELIEAHPEYDGMIFDEGGDPDGNGGVTYRGVSYMPFNGGTQVKSATSNNGEYSQTNPDVRFSVKRYRDFATAQQAQKLPGMEYPTDQQMVRFSLSNRNRTTVSAWLRKRKDLTDDQRKVVVDYLDELSNPKLQLATARWFAQGVIRLPEDMPKVEQAVAVADKAKVDPLQYGSPMELIEAHADIEIKEKPINPDTVPTLHKAKEYKDYGIVVYDVDDTEESRENLRKIINTHYGKEASPWCLLQGDGNGKLTDASRQFWRSYNSYPKQVAFRNGKLLAFSANDSERRVWWDRQDAPHDGFPLDMPMPNDKLKRAATYTLNPETGKLSEPYNKHRGNKQNGTYEEWNELEVLTTRRHYKNGRMDGVQETFWSGGEIQMRENCVNGITTGKYTTWYANGQVQRDYNFDENGLTSGEQKEYNADGSLAYRCNYVRGKRDGLEERWNTQGQLIGRTGYKDGKKHGVQETWNDHGQPQSYTEYKEGKREGLNKIWHWNGVLAREAHYHDDIVTGDQKTWYESGNLNRHYHFDEDGALHGVQEGYFDFVGREVLAERWHYEHGSKEGLHERWHDEGKPRLRETYADDVLEGLSLEWHPNGVLKSIDNYKKGKSDGIAEQWTDTGRLWYRREFVNGKEGRDLGTEPQESVYGDVRFSTVTDKAELERLEKEPTVTLYRAMELIDGELYPPMSQKVPNAKEEKGKKMQRREGVKPGMWQKSDEDPAKAYQKKKGGPWYYDLKKIDSKQSDTNGVLYNPYLHLSASPLNDQFSAASKRPNLVTVACEVPVSEFTSGYKAEKANDSVGPKDWHSGTVTAQLGEGRQVVLSRWAKIGRIVPDSEVASIMAPKLVAKDITVPANVVTSSLRAALEARGVKFAEPESEEEDVRFSVTGQIQDEDGNMTRFSNEGGLPAGPKRQTLVERTYRKTGAFSFTGKDKIESAGDVAYIFKELETAAVENSFVVYVKGGVPTILHTGIGNIDSVGVDEAAFAAGLKDFAPDEVYLVHNHPSGRVEASRADVSQLEVMQRMAGEVPVSGVIIDTTSGEYGLFDHDTFPSTLIDNRSKENEGNFPLEVKAFDKMVFAPEYRANISVAGITGPEDVASYLSAHRLGAGQKVGALLLDTGNRVVGNVVLNDNIITKDNANAIAGQIVDAAVHSAAKHTVLFGDFSFTVLAIAKFRSELSVASGGRVSLMDVVRVEGNHTRAMSNETLSDSAGEDVRFSISPEQEERYLAEARNYINESMSEAGEDEFEIVNMKVIGSRANGNARSDSDLDILVEYRGSMREDDAFDALHDSDNPLDIDGVPVDINPIREEETGTIEDWEERQRRWKEEDRVRFSLVAPAGATREEVMTAAKKAMPRTKVVDRYGKPKVVYHGTPSEPFNTFSYDDEFYYMNSNRSVARQYTHRRGIFGPRPEQIGRVMPVFVNLENPYIIDAGRRNWDNINVDWKATPADTREIAVYAKEHGFDGVIIKRVRDNMWNNDGTYGDDIIAFDPIQIKSAGPTYQTKRRDYFPWDEYEDLVSEVGDTFDDEGNRIPLERRFDFDYNDDIRFSVANRNQEVFISNAAKAAEEIKMDKATPEQWIKMLEKGGGLKAGEDKWIGLSDWLKASDKKTLSKQEIVDYINQHQIQIEEVPYSERSLFSPNSKRNLESEIQRGMKDGESIEDVLMAWDSEFGDDKLVQYEDGRFTISEDGTIETDEDLAMPINETRLQYTTLGLDNHREIALTVPTIEPWNQYDQIHFGDAGEGRAVAWIRFGDGKDSTGQRVLVIDEIQSKRHQEGREKGYANRKNAAALFDKAQQASREYAELSAELNNEDRPKPPTEADWDRLAEARRRMEDAVKESNRASNGIPAAPFEKNWHELAMKRMLRLAAEEGYDYVAWTTGAQQAERYSLSRVAESAYSVTIPEVPGGYEGQHKSVSIQMQNGGAMALTVDKNGVVLGGMNGGNEFVGRNLSDIVGKETAVRLMENDGKVDFAEQKIGGEGMKGFYDDILPRFMNKYGKKWGVKVEDINLPALGRNRFVRDVKTGEYRREGLTMHAVPVTQEMKESVMQGQVMFSVRAAEGVRSEGISAVVGRENVGDFYMDLYHALPADMRKDVAGRAMGNGLNIRNAMQDYISEAAARGEDGTGVLRMAETLLGDYAEGELDEATARYALWRGGRGVNDDDLLDVAHDQFMRNHTGVGQSSENSGQLGVRFSVGDEVKAADAAAEAAVDEADAAMKAGRKEIKDLLTMAKAMGLQKEYDKKTVEAVTNLAKQLLKDQYVDALSRREVSRLLGIVRTSVGRSAKMVKKNADAIVEMVIDNLLRREREGLKKLTSTSGSKTNATGVEVMGSLDVQGQKTMKAFKEGLKLDVGKVDDSDDANTLYGMRARLQSRLTSKDDAVRKEAEAEDAGLALAIEYKEGVKALEDEEKSLQDDLKDAAAAFKDGDMSKTNYEEFVRATEDSMRENHIEQVESLRAFRRRMQEVLSGSAEAKKTFMEREKERVEAIHHLANSDMQGRSASKEKRPGFWDKVANSPIVRFFAAPLATFDQMLRLFGEKSINGEGYLYNKFMRGWLEASERAYIGQRDAKAELNKKASEVFGREMIWSDIYGEERKMQKATVKWWDDGKMAEHELTQGQLLYIYMVNKMADGRMKLRKMGIDEDAVEAIRAQMDERFLALADWLQDEYLVKLRNKYNAIHERLFGASMAAIENYFPLKINKRDLNRNEDIAAPDYESLPSTTTGSIIKRRRNSKALDLLNADAFSVVIEHIDQMEQWAAFAEFNKDVNALLSYKRFRNQVQNMASVYGSGTTLWDNFKDVARIAGNSYHPQVGRNQLDSAAVNLAKGVTSAKISFRVYTALKQFLSMPAFVADANIGYLAKNMATPWNAWNWAMENLPVFEKRWKSRIAGDTRLMSTDADWKLFRTRLYDKLSSLGMSPNAFVDAVTVAIGARSMYETKYAQYIKEGFSEAQADKKAKQDATILYNETQQSNENAFLSTAQLDRTVFATAITVFRNSSMGFQRQVHDALRNIGKHMKPGYREQSIEFMTKQLVREGLSEEQAAAAAERRYNRSLMRDSVRLATFGFLVEFAWNLGGSIVYLLFGDDDDEKEKMLSEAFWHALIGGSMEGLTAGNVLSDALNNVAKGESLRNYDPTLLPILSDMKRAYSMMDYDKVAGWNEYFNLGIQALSGVNPQTITDTIVAVADACNGDLDTSKEAMLLIMRVLQVPQSQIDQIYIDELGTNAAGAKRMSPKQMAKRYAEYKLQRSAPLTGGLYPDELREKRRKAYEKSFNKKVKERKDKK